MFQLKLSLLVAIIFVAFEAIECRKVKPSPKSCALKRNEVYIAGGSPCQTTCATLNEPCLIQTFAPVNACYCIDGYARNKWGTCVRINSQECQSICKVKQAPSAESCARKPNEVYIDGGSACQSYCNDPWAPCAIRPIAPVKACYCKNGYARDNKNGTCIAINSDQCQNTCWIDAAPSVQSCARKSNEVYIAGGSPCQTTCATLNEPCNIQTFAPVNACYCINGYARDSNDACIQINSNQCQQLCASAKNNAQT